MISKVKDQYKFLFTIGEMHTDKPLYVTRMGRFVWFEQLVKYVYLSLFQLINIQHFIISGLFVVVCSDAIRCGKDQITSTTAATETGEMLHLSQWSYGLSVPLQQMQQRQPDAGHRQDRSMVLQAE